MRRIVFALVLAALAAGLLLGIGGRVRGVCREGQGRLHDSSAAGGATAP